MEKLKELNNFTKITLSLGLVLLIYGFISQVIPINFFWESTSIGWFILCLGIIGILASGIKRRKTENKKTIWNKIGIGFICFILLVQTILIIIIPNTDAYRISKEFIKNNEELKLSLGNINEFGLVPTGGISVRTDSKGKTGNANISLIVKGDKAYKKVTVLVYKNYGKDWEVYKIE